MTNQGGTSGHIIFLNGTSSAGKTSLAKALQAATGDAYGYIAVDDFGGTFIPGIHGLLTGRYPHYRNELDLERPGMLWGTIFPAVLTLMNHTIRHLSEQGQCVIVDHVLESDDWLRDCVRLLHDRPVTFVGVRCSLEELERREAARGDRRIGLAREQFAVVHEGRIYDVEVDSERYSPEENARFILERQREQQAFPAMFERYQ